VRDYAAPNSPRRRAALQRNTGAVAGAEEFFAKIDEFIARL